MDRTVTGAEWEEYQALKLYHRRQLEMESAEGLTLEADIDLPIRKCVMAFALLGCGPIWSCCGFDYPGQPIHKWHQYGRIFFILSSKIVGAGVVMSFILTHGGKERGWSLKEMPGGLDLHLQFANPIPQWRQSDCIHFYEPAAIAIRELEVYLLSLKAIMSEEVRLSDSNQMYKDQFIYWQYPAHQDWLIRKSEL